MTHLNLVIPLKQELGKQIYNALQGPVVETIQHAFLLLLISIC